MAFPPFAVAVIVALPVPEDPAVALNFAVLLPVRTVTDAGTETSDKLELESVTVVLDDAVPLIVTVTSD